MTVVRRKLLALSIVLPAVAVGAFTVATPVQADCSVGPQHCCFAGETYSLGSCRYMGSCWYYVHKCVQGPGDAYWEACTC